MNAWMFVMKSVMKAVLMNPGLLVIHLYRPFQM